MRILHDLCSLPTAPFLEHRIVEYVRQFVRARRNLRFTRDEHGNVLVALAGKRKRSPRWVFAAHIDHPGLVARRMVDRGTLDADFRGHVLAEYMRDTKVRFFDNGREVAGRVIHVTRRKDGLHARSVRVRVARAVPPGAIGMLDQGEGRIRAGKFYCRGCDDVAGAAAALAMIDRLRANPPASPVAVLLTRAEEEGFVGAIAAAQHPRLLRKTDRIISIETSAEQPYAPQGRGPIIRVGDRTSVFNSALTYFLTQQAEALRKRSASFHYQRALMPGGTCEATVYDAYGYRSAATCVALGNYHNMDRRRKKIGPEYVSVRDWNNMVKLFVAIARNAYTYQDGHASLRQAIETRFEKVRHLL